MGRKIQLIRWALVPASVVGLALAPQALAGGLTGVVPATAGQLAAPVSADSVVVETTAPVQNGAVEQAATAALSVVAVAATAVIQPAQTRVPEVRAAAVHTVPLPRAAVHAATVAETVTRVVTVQLAHPRVGGHARRSRSRRLPARRFPACRRPQANGQASFRRLDGQASRCAGLPAHPGARCPSRRHPSEPCGTLRDGRPHACPGAAHATGFAGGARPGRRSCSRWRALDRSRPRTGPRADDRWPRAAHSLGLALPLAHVGVSARTP